jgi:hypothetical protein
MEKQDSYEYLLSKIDNFRKTYSLCRNEDDYLFTGLLVKSVFYKNPSYILRNDDLAKFLVDGPNDGGNDAILNDPSSEASDLVLVQSKFYKTITVDEIKDSVHKLYDSFAELKSQHYDHFNARTIKQFSNCYAEVGDESKIHFVFATSAPQSGIKKQSIIKAFNDNLGQQSQFDLSIYFADDIVDEIKEAESLRPTVEQGTLSIDAADNILSYEDGGSVIVNISASSLKELYAQNTLNLLSRNLRYFVRKKDIDEAINKTIKEKPNSFWYKNNGITIICDDFEIENKKLKLHNFSIINGGQTTTLIFKNPAVDYEDDFYLPCKIIKSQGNDDDEKSNFILEIAKATNSQKPIKQIDLKANAPEQIRFSNILNTVGVFYQTKRGEIIPKNFSNPAKNTDLSEVGKLCLAGIYQLPASSRNRPSIMYDPAYYEPLFNKSEEEKVAKFVKDLLYVDDYFKERFLERFDKEAQQNVITFAHNARTICVAFVSLASRYASKALSDASINVIVDSNNNKDGYYAEKIYNLVRYLGTQENGIFENITLNYDERDQRLFNLFSRIITEGYKAFSLTKKASIDSPLNETNYLKNDVHYYDILSSSWSDLKREIDDNKDLFIK